MRMKYEPYDIVRFSTGDEDTEGVVVNWHIAWEDVSYTVRLEDGEECEVPEAALSRTGHMEQDLSNNEIVIVHPDDPVRNRDMDGKRGAICGHGYDFNDREWGYGVIAQDGYVWSFMRHELEQTGIWLPEWIVRSRQVGTVIHVAGRENGERFMPLQTCADSGRSQLSLNPDVGCEAAEVLVWSVPAFRSLHSDMQSESLFPRFVIAL